MSSNQENNTCRINIVILNYMISKEIEKSYRNIYSKRFTRKAFAQKINISPSALTKIEANGVITPRVMDSICRYFNFEGPWEFYEIARNIHSQ